MWELQTHYVINYINCNWVNSSKWKFKIFRLFKSKDQLNTTYDGQTLYNKFYTNSLGKKKKNTHFLPHMPADISYKKAKQNKANRIKAKDVLLIRNKSLHNKLQLSFLSMFNPFLFWGICLDIHLLASHWHLKSPHHENPDDVLCRPNVSIAFPVYLLLFLSY